MSNLKTNLNTSPYFDDYDESKEFYRILHRPRVPIQARELTQSQTMAQKQIQRIGDHVFKDGSVVDGIHVTYLSNFDYVSVSNLFFTLNTRSITSIDSTYLLVGETTGVRAIALATKTGFEASFPNSNRFYVKYIYTGTSASKFAPGEYVRVYGPNQDKLGTLNEGNFVDKIAVINNIAGTGQGYGVTVSDGIIYHKGFFLKVDAQTVVVKEFDTDPTGYRVGFDTAETIVTEDVDSSLNDNATGYPNFNAPGAHRLKLVPFLISKFRTDDTINTNFFAIVEFDTNNPTEQNTDAVYNKLGDEFAIRTNEESGDYTVKPFSIETFPGTNSNTNLVDANLFSYSVSTGIAYVKGYRVEKIGTSPVTVNRAFTSVANPSQIITMNYGNYLVISEVMGYFDVKNYPEVTLYDAAQTTITDAEKASGARAGSIVGYANLRYNIYYSGTKGLPSCQFIAYLDNIRMNTGKNFSTDVKSIYSTSAYGDARADAVLTTNFYANGTSYSKANLVDSSFNTLVFPAGVPAVKSLFDNVGASRTQFIFRDVANGTLQTNGFISITTNPAAAGGPEKINASGTLTLLSDKNNFDIILTTDVFTANLTGTVSVNTSNGNVTGTSTSFSTQFVTGGYIRVGSDSRRVTAITNATFMTVASAFSVVNASANYQRHYLEGTHVDLSSASANVVVTSNTTFNINSFLNLGATVNATSTVRVTYPILKTTATQEGKTVNKSRWVKIDCSNNVTGSTGPWCLGLPDVYSIQKVYVGTTYSNTNTDGTAWFNLDSGLRPGVYDSAYLQLNPAYASNISGTSKLLIQLSHFTANTSSGVGFFSVDSYPTSNTTSNTTIGWGEIPVYNDPSGTKYDLRNCIDLRPYKANTAVSATVDSSATINPALPSANTLAAGTYGFLASPDSNFQADVYSYLPRRDLVVVNKNGDFSVISGKPDVFPATPFADNDVMVIAEAYVPAWPTLTTREADALKRNDIKVKHSIKTNPRYTMRDIGALDKRLTRVEYYTVLNAVEQKAKDFTIQDTSGLDRFKNGIFADPFNSHALGKVTDFEYKIAIDQDKGIARPFFAQHQIDLMYNSSLSTTQRTGNAVLMPYTEEGYIVQGYASKYRNCTESVWNWTGKLTLYPKFDDHKDITNLPNNNVSLDLSQAWQDFANSPFGSQYGAWRTTKAVTKNNQSGDTITTTTTATQTQIINSMKVNTLTSSQNLGTYVTDISTEPYMASRLVAFSATNLKPNTTVHAFFDQTSVDVYCAPGTWSGIANPEVGREDKVVNRTGAFGAPLKTDATGSIQGVFLIPPATFRTGDRTFMLTDVSSLVTGLDAALTIADARFSASNLAVTTQGTTLTTIEPTISTVQTSVSRVTTSTSVSALPPQNSSSRPDPKDPIGQSFFNTVPDGISGSFLTKLDLYFEAADTSLGVTLLITETRLGQPDTGKILGQCHLTAAQINVSEDGTIKTTFVLDEPVFLNSNAMYAFLVKPDGDSPNYRIWMGETGGYDVATGTQIYQNPYAGTAFVSSNMNSWTTLQTEDIKFTAYRAVFSAGSATAYFDNQGDDFISFTGFILANSSTQPMVGDLCYTANSTTTLTGANTTQPYGIIQYLDLANQKVFIDSSTGGWTPGQTLQFHRPTALGNTSLINANSLIGNSTISTIDNQNYHAVVPRFSTITPGRTNIFYSFRGTSNTYVVDTSYVTTTNDTEYEFNDTTRVAMSYSNELTLLSSQKSSRHQLQLTTDNAYVSPVIDLRKKSSLKIENLINNDQTGEANTRLGKASTKYVSQNVVLDDGQESDDIHIWMSNYRPVGTDVSVYVKFQNNEDGDVFDNKVWTLMTAASNSSVYSSSTDTSDYIEYEYTLPASAPASNPTAAFLNANTGLLRYVRADGVVFDGYKTFCLKIVLTSSNAARVPLLNDVRAICLQA